MKVSYIKKETDGVVEEMLELTYVDARYISEQITYLTFDEASDIADALVKKLSSVR